ncbi:50S ribosomal protein L29 [Acidianus brierleyi]|uniref:Large ribosomal subunit protein uL29 n=1 Tax=Acidianus brierleyi TaxID=41673 RepID=A0A2U9IEG8_9CREN|nr:50S ribosomal protein L29 [Acidianus brierleyi]AWR94395.1 50S ribosomal protein L29 [Acidianus brierleyi]
MPHKTNDFLEDIRKLEIQDLNKRLQDTIADLIKLRAEARVGTIKDTASIRNMRKNIARLKTVINEKKRNSHREEKH